MIKSFSDDFGPLSINDLLLLFLGDQIGQGASRRVYAHGQRADLVVKVEDTAGSFSNVREWDVWDCVKETDFAKWFAPCEQIASAGSVLLQRRTRPLTLDELKAGLPRVPVFFTDLKAANWGRLDGRIVCHDYGNHLLYERGMRKGTKNADWWE